MAFSIRSSFRKIEIKGTTLSWTDKLAGTAALRQSGESSANSSAARHQLALVFLLPSRTSSFSQTNEQRHKPLCYERILAGLKIMNLCERRTAVGESLAKGLEKGS